jgi:hypothetical protein
LTHLLMFVRSERAENSLINMTQMETSLVARHLVAKGFT